MEWEKEREKDSEVLLRFLTFQAQGPVIPGFAVSNSTGFGGTRFVRQHLWTGTDRFPVLCFPSFGGPCLH